MILQTTKYSVVLMIGIVDQEVHTTAGLIDHRFPGEIATQELVMQLERRVAGLCLVRHCAAAWMELFYYGRGRRTSRKGFPGRSTGWAMDGTESETSGPLCRLLSQAFSIGWMTNLQKSSRSLLWTSDVPSEVFVTRSWVEWTLVDGWNM